MKSPEEFLVDFLQDCGTKKLDAEALEKAVHLVVDAMTLAKKAAPHAVVKAVESLTTKEAGGDRLARTWTTGERIPVSEAVLVNATATHAFFQDDTDMTAWAHPGSLVPMAAFGLAEAEGLGVGQALRGLVAGYATLNWLGAEEKVARQVVEKGFRASAVFGPIAAAAAGAATLRLDPLQTRNAIALAVDTAGGSLEPVRSGAQDWRLQNGFAAQRGAMAALLARAGVQGPPQPFTGKGGFLTCFTDGETPEAWRRPPQIAALKGVWFKPYPTLGDNMAPVVAASALTGKIPELSKIETVEIRMNAHFAEYPGTQYRGPFERTEQMITSTAFAVATLLVHGDLDYGDYGQLISDERVLGLVAKTTIKPVEGMDYLDGSVEVRTSEEAIRADASDVSRTVFFRDRKATRAIVERRLGSKSALDAILFEIVDGIEPSFDEILAELHKH
ncbi:MmgE/PrpD family protein [Propylenella binzhouense]|uniref:MmgE/PrpD N-terminal domain-containing protein n=1 Tax=Propylenella binzhouense TaxID=2555902 RepID=A0A964T1A9_9HYPH|nr:MmgE/PrpD family protein [Propylenella binzhouense]MYZ46558.1 hypothetical protein [Propylenella binzhouense]